MSEIDNNLCDSEANFLKPINEYNIIDKIQSANSQFFSLLENNKSQMDPDPNKPMNTNINNTDLLQSKHRVTFSSDIDEYDDNLSDSSDEKNQYKDDEAINKELNEIIDRSENGSESNSNLNGFLQMSIEELYDNNNSNASNLDTNSLDNNENTTDVEIAQEIADSISMVSLKENDILKDSPKNQYQMHSNTKMPIELDQSKGMAIKWPTIPVSTTATKSLTFVKHNNNNKRKSFDLRKAHKTYRCKSAGHQNGSGQIIINATKEDENLLKIHLNVKSCCELKYLDNNRLPRYNGFFSQYGLSKDQLEQREQYRRKCIESRMKRQREIMQAKQQIANLNELAFRQWLIRKNHEIKPKFKNFYDSTNNTNSNGNLNMNIKMKHTNENIML